MDDPLLLAIGGTIVAACIFALGFLSFAEAALLGISEVRLRSLCRTGDPRTDVLKDLVAENDFLSTIIVGVNVCVITVSTVTTVVVSRVAFLHEGWREQAIHIGMLLFMLIVAEIAPKTYGAMFAERVALKVARPVAILARIFGPVMRVISGVANFVLRLFGAEVGHYACSITKDEIRVAADVGKEEGALEPEEGEMIDSVLELSIAQASDIMVPRVDIVALAEDAAEEQILDVVSKSGYSRIPIYAETLDDITGVLYLNDVLKRFLEHGVSSINVREIARPAMFVPESKPLDELFSEMREMAVHIAIVVDEYGGTEGLVTVEDILEELVGEIEDEHDIVEDEIFFISEDEAVFSSKVRIEDVNDALDILLPTDQYDTIGGLVVGIAHTIPEVNDAFTIDGIRLVVEDGDEQHIDQVRVVVTLRDGCEE